MRRIEARSDFRRLFARRAQSLAEDAVAESIRDLFSDLAADETLDMPQHQTALSCRLSLSRGDLRFDESLDRADAHEHHFMKPRDQRCHFWNISDAA